LRSNVLRSLAFYSTTSSLCAEKELLASKDGENNTEAENATVKLLEEKFRRRLIAQDYNNRRAAYNRQVSHLRRSYAEEVKKQRETDTATKEAQAKELTRKRLERQRQKNIRSAQNALQQEVIRAQQKVEFEKHLEREQIKRDSKKERFRLARQLAINDLEKEAPLWLTSVEEVEAAFTPEAVQLLWGRPGGILGAPNPSLSSSFWQFETHTWHMDRTYKSRRELLLEQLEEEAYEESNVDHLFWTPERKALWEQLREKARLRAMVQTAGRVELMRRQNLMLEEAAATELGEAPKLVAPPSHTFLTDVEALEREGAAVLLDDPTKFFVFENESVRRGNVKDVEGERQKYVGPTLGAPIALRDRLRDGSYQNRVFPLAVGKVAKPDTRSEREKKQQEREQRMWAAAEASRRQESTAGLDLAAIDQGEDSLVPDVDYNATDLDWDSDDENWKANLDPDADAAILAIPRERRYNEEDIDWVVQKLDEKISHLEQQAEQDLQSLRLETEMEAVGESDLDKAFLSLTDKELFELSDLHERFLSESMSTEEFNDAARAIPGLSVEQIRSIFELSKGAAS
jgi:hypothetical protein